MKVLICSQLQKKCIQTFLRAVRSALAQLKILLLQLKILPVLLKILPVLLKILLVLLKILTIKDNIPPGILNIPIEIWMYFLEICTFEHLNIWTSECVLYKMTIDEFVIIIQSLQYKLCMDDAQQLLNAYLQVVQNNL